MSHMTRVLAISNQKGGVGKTTTAVNLASALALAEQTVLLIDLDPQGNASSGLGHPKHTAKEGLADVLLGFVPLGHTLCTTDVDGLHLCPATKELVGLEVELVETEQREYRLKKIIQTEARDYDYVIIDCPPALNLLTVNALAAADGVLIPLQAEYYAMEGLTELLRTVSQVRKGLNPKLERAGILLTMVDYRTNLCRDVAAQTQQVFGDEVFQTTIPRNVRLSEAPSFGQSIHAYDPLSNGAKAYNDLAAELLEREGRLMPQGLKVPGHRRAVGCAR